MVPKFETRAQKFRKDDGGLSQLLYAKPVFGSYSGTLLKPGNFRRPACPGSTCTVSHASAIGIQARAGASRRIATVGTWPNPRATVPFAENGYGRGRGRR